MPRLMRTGWRPFCFLLPGCSTRFISVTSFMQISSQVTYLLLSKITKKNFSWLTSLNHLLRLHLRRSLLPVYMLHQNSVWGLLCRTVPISILFLRSCMRLSPVVCPEVPIVHAMENSTYGAQANNRFLGAHLQLDAKVAPDLGGRRRRCADP